MMSTATAPRARHERQIKLLNSTFGREFDKALDRVIRRLGGLDFFNDAQIALIREEMIITDWERHKLNRENRKRRIA
jgi:hypothetical protein